MMMTGLGSELSHVVEPVDPLALPPIDAHLEAFGSFWIDEADMKQAEAGETAYHFNLDRSGDEIMPDWMSQAQLPQEIHDAENTAELDLPLYDPPSVASTFSTSGDFAGFSENELKTLSTKDLNLTLKRKGLSRGEAQMVKQRRRTIKNRGYAQECRRKRTKRTESLETRNDNLGTEMARARGEIDAVKRERDMYKSSWRQLVDRIDKHGLNDLFFGEM